MTAHKSDANPMRAVVVLAGGASRRMGRDKAWVDLAGEPLLSRVARGLAPAAAALFVARGMARDLPPLPPSARVLDDAEPAGSGPLAGVAAVAAALEPGITEVFVCACDVPFVTAATVEQLARGLGTHAGIVPVLEQRPQPLCALYRRATIEAARAAFATGTRRASSLAEGAGIRLAAEADLRALGIDPGTLRSFNNERELDELRRRQR